MIHLVLTVLAWALPALPPGSPPPAQEGRTQEPFTPREPEGRTQELLAPRESPAVAVALVDLFGRPSEDLVVMGGAGDGAWTVVDLLREYARITGQHLQVDEQTRSVLVSRTTGLARNVAVPAAEVQSFVEHLLVQNNCMIEVLRRDAPRLLAIRSLETGRSPARSRAVFVTETELGAWSAHPAVLITTLITLPHVDVRQLSNSMRTIITDANVQMMMPAGNTNSMVLTGLAARVVDLAHMLEVTDEAARVQAVEPAIERFRLQNAVAPEIAGAVQELVSPLASQLRAQGGMVQGQPVRTVRVIADARTNSLVVVALPDSMPIVRRVVELLDSRE